MCGRFTIAISAKKLAAFFFQQVQEIDKRYNVAPTQPIPVILQDSESSKRIMMAMRWGLIPHWAKDDTIGSRLINARGETVDKKPTFRSAFEHRRCMIPTTGFYEWDKSKELHQPYFIGMADGSPFALAGLWEVWNDGDGNEV